MFLNHSGGNPIYVASCLPAIPILQHSIGTGTLSYWNSISKLDRKFRIAVSVSDLELELQILETGLPI